MHRLARSTILEGGGYPEDPKEGKGKETEEVFVILPGVREDQHLRGRDPYGCPQAGREPVQRPGSMNLKGLGVRNQISHVAGGA